MNKPVISVQGSGKKLILIGIAMIIFAAIFLAACASDVEGSRDEETLIQTFFIITVLIEGVGIFVIVTGVKFSKTYISVFEDYIQGEGLVNFSRGSFSLKYNKITSAIANKDRLLINSNGVIYKIGISSSDSSRIVRYINDKI